MFENPEQLKTRLNSEAARERREKRNNIQSIRRRFDDICVDTLSWISNSAWGSKEVDIVDNGFSVWYSIGGTKVAVPTSWSTGFQTWPSVKIECYKGDNNHYGVTIIFAGAEIIRLENPSDRELAGTLSVLWDRHFTELEPYVSTVSYAP